MPATNRVVELQDDNAELFLSYPSRNLIDKFSYGHSSEGWVKDESEPLALHVLRKDPSGGYAAE